MTSDQHVIKDRLDLEMLERPHLWPARERGFRCVMLKRKGDATADWTETAKCIMEDAHTYVLMVFNWRSENPTEGTLMRYDSPQAVLADGWVVD